MGTLTKISTDDYRFIGKPAVATSDGKTYVFIRDKNNLVQWKSHDGNSWSPNDTTFNKLGDDNVRVVNDLTAAGRSNKTIDLFFIDVEQRVQWNSSNGGSDWTGWKPLSDAGGYLSIVAAISSTESQTIDLFVRRIDNSVHQKHYNGTTWSPADSNDAWTSLGTTNKFKGGPTSVAATSDSFFVFARGGADNHLYVKKGSSSEITASGTGSSTWTNLSGTLMADVSAVSTDSDDIKTFHLGWKDAHTYLKAYDSDSGKWDTDYTDLGGPLLSAPAARAISGGKIHLFALATSNHISSNVWDPSAKKWSGWTTEIDGHWTAEPVLNPNKNQVFLRNPRGLLYFYTY